MMLTSHSPSRMDAVATNHWLSAALATCAALAACGGNDGNAPAVDPPNARAFAVTLVAGSGGSLRVSVGSGDAATVNAGSSRVLTVDAGDTLKLEAAATGTAVFAGWTGKCAGSGAVCHMTAIDIERVEATFGPVAKTLTVAADAGGSARVAIGSAALRTVAGSGSETYIVAEQSMVRLEPSLQAGHRFGGWTLDGEPSCASARAVCTLAAGATSGSVSAGFAFATYTVTVSAAADGLVTVAVDGVDLGTVGAGASSAVSVTIAASLRLTSIAATAGQRFDAWTLSGPLSCADGPRVSPCALAPVVADGSVSAAFAPLPATLTWVGPGAVFADGAMLTATPFAPNAFDRWQGAPCDGSTALVCGRGASALFPVAVFHPLAVGIKSLTFGWAYPGVAADHFRVSFQDVSGGGFAPIPGFERLVAGSAPVRLAVSTHRGARGAGRYQTEACDSAQACTAPTGGARTLSRADMAAAVGYFKAPNTGVNVHFGNAIALSADGVALAVGASNENSSHTGAFAPGDPGWHAALDNRGVLDSAGDCDIRVAGHACSSGAVTVYRQSSTGRWMVEAFVKAPLAGSSDNFGDAVALSVDGAVLAVGATFEDSSASGAFAPSDADWYAALRDDSADNSGAVTVYRRSDAGLWSAEAFVKAPAVTGGDFFGGVLQLSAGGDVLAVGAKNEDSARAGVVTPSDEDWSGALENDQARDSGAVTVYRFSTANSTWQVDAFIKAPAVNPGDSFGVALALSADGKALAVGAPLESSSHTGAFAPGDVGYRAVLESDGADDSGAVTVYRRSDAGLWSVEAFVKAPASDVDDEFGVAVALSADGNVLAVGTKNESSSATGVFAPSDADWHAALRDDSADDSGAVTVYRRSDAGLWSVEAFVKAPATDVDDEFGAAVALSADGNVLAVGTKNESSAHTGAFAPGDVGYRAALRDDSAEDSGAVTVYRRSDAGLWSVKTFVKAPNADAHDEFGAAIALSADGAALAVGAKGEHGGAQPQPRGSHMSDAENAVRRAGAAYLY